MSASANKRPGPRGIRLSRGDIAFNIINYTVFGLITLLCIFPFYYLFINTISSNELVRLGKIQLWPRDIHLENYVQVLKVEGIADALFTSLARTSLGTVWTVAGCAFLGYLVTKEEMWLRKVWYRLIIITMYFFATGSCITELESNGQDVDGADGVIPYKLPKEDSASYAYAAEDKHRG